MFCIRESVPESSITMFTHHVDSSSQLGSGVGCWVDGPFGTGKLAN